jgi:Ran GTPase-activating protein (RanGAP) involved in mRNA processing and transport
VAAVPGRWAVLDFRGCAVRVNRDALVALCARAGAELRELRLDAPACNSLWPDSITTALENGGCRGLRRYTQPLTSPAGEQWSPFGEYTHPPFGIKPRYAVALARVCPALEHAACRVLLRYSWDVLDLSEVPGPVTLVLPRWGWHASQQLETLSLHRSIAALDVHSAYLGNEGAAVFSKALSEDGSSVASVDFSSNQMTDTGVRSLAEMLRVNTTLKDLNLSHNYFYDDGVAALGEALRVNATLTRLVLSYNSAGDNGAASLAAALLVNTGLKDLQLRRASIGLAGATALAEALMVNRTLTSVDLGFNEDIRNAGAVKFAHMLEDNSTLRSLDLSACNIKDLGANAIGQALQDNTALTSLDLSYNKLTDECLALIAAAMTRENASLLNLNLCRAAANAKALLEQSSDGSRPVATKLRLLLFSQDVIASEDNASSV